MEQEPELYRYLTHFWVAFQRLGTCRPLGPVGVGQIPWDAMHKYATEVLHLEDEAYDEFIRIIENLDETFLKHMPKPDKNGQKGKR